MFNTLLYAKKWEAVGISREQAETHVQIIAEITEGNLSTKQDIKNLENELVKMEYRLVIKMGTMIAVGVAVLATLMKFF